MKVGKVILWGGVPVVAVLVCYLWWSSRQGGSTEQDDASGEAVTAVGAGAGLAEGAGAGGAKTAGTAATVATKPGERSVRDWELANEASLLNPKMEVAQQSQQLKGEGDGLYCLAFSPNGQLLATGGGDGNIILWNMKTMEKSKVLEAHKSVVCALAFSPDGKTLVSGSADYQLILWNVETGEIDNMLKQEAPVMCAAFLPDGKQFVTANGAHVRMWRVDSERSNEIDGAEGTVETIGVSAKGELAIGTNTGWVMAYDPAESKIVGAHHRRGISQPNIRPVGVRLAQFLKDGQILIVETNGVWKWDTEKDQISFVLPATAPWGVALASDEQLLVCPDRQVFRYMQVAEPLESMVIATRGLPGRAPIDLQAAAISPAGDYAAVARGGGYKNGEWQHTDGVTIDIYDAKKLEASCGYRTKQRDLENERRVLLGSKPIVPARQEPTPGWD